MHCETLLSSPQTFPFPTINPTTITTSSSSSSNRVSFPTRPTKPPGLSFTTRATLNDGWATKPISEMSFYELLGIPETGSLPDIKQAYKQLARKYHPDVSPPDRVKEYTERFIRVQEAYETLSDPKMRAVYDRDLSRGLHLAFSARKMVYRYDEKSDDKSEWRSRWESQLSGLKKRSKHRAAGENMSWGARMRGQRNVST